MNIPTSELMKVAVFSAVVLLFAACTHTQHTASGGCQELDWYELGRQDGTQGSQATRRSVAAVCDESDQSLSEALYNNGFDAGVSQYCAPQNGFELGRSGQPIVAGVCPNLQQEEFVQRYEQGQRFTRLEKQSQDIERRIQSLESHLSNKSVELTRRGLLNGEKIQLQEKKKMLDAELNAISQAKN